LTGASSFWARRDSPGASVCAFFECTFSVSEKQSNAAAMGGSGAAHETSEHVFDPGRHLAFWVN
jgi:hypothetical protein